MEEKETVVVESPEITDSDFAFVQQDKSIHDTKFDTKPTTFFKDALKRFAKNKSSVAAAGILAVIIMMAIVVPVADTNDIAKDVKLPAGITIYPSNLPPKWFDNAGGFMDGTGFIEDAICAPVKGENGEITYLPDAKMYDLDAIVPGTLVTKEGLQSGDSSQILAYGKGGVYTLKNTSKLDDFDEFVCADMGLESAVFTLPSSARLHYTMNLDGAFYDEKEVENTATYVTLDLVVGDAHHNVYPRTNLHGLNKIDIPDLFASCREALPSTVSASIRIQISCDDIYSTRNSMYISTIEASVEGQNAEDADSSLVSSLVMADAVKEYAKEKTSAPAYKCYNGAAKTLNNVTVISASFRYDYYEAAFGDKSGIIIDYAVLDTYVKAGFIEWTWDGKTKGTDVVPAEGSYRILDSEKSPIREIESYTYTTKKDMFGNVIETKQLKVVLSMYRYYAFNGHIGSYSSPKFIFGTDANSKDFFKIVFSGLLSSLGLGLLAATINIFVGLVYGALAGYFGGWTDILMERFTEILGGMPWIVLMTLIVLLLGSNFWTLLLALCLTGWIGVAGTTRSQFYRYKGREYVLASRTLGASDGRLIFQHILPNGIGTIVTGAVLMIPSVIFTEANISYLLPNLFNDNSGRVSFGITLSEAQASLERYPFLIVSASIVMILIMIAFNLFGNGLRDAFNPSLKGADD